LCRFGSSDHVRFHRQWRHGVGRRRVLSPCWYFLTYYFQLVLGYGPVKAGLVFVPTAIAIILGAQIRHGLSREPVLRPLLQIGATLATLGFFWLSLIKPDSTLGHVFAPSFITAFAMGLCSLPWHGSDVRCRPGRRGTCFRRSQYRAPGRRLVGPRHSRHRRDDRTNSLITGGRPTPP